MHWLRDLPYTKYKIEYRSEIEYKLLRIDEILRSFRLYPLEKMNKSELYIINEIIRQFIQFNEKQRVDLLYFLSKIVLTLRNARANITKLTRGIH